MSCVCFTDCNAQLLHAATTGNRTYDSSVLYLEVDSAVHLICLIDKSPKLGNARIPRLGYVQLRNFQYLVLFHWFKVHNIADKNKEIRFIKSEV